MLWEIPDVPKVADLGPWAVRFAMNLAEVVYRYSGQRSADRAMEMFRLPTAATAQWDREVAGFFEVAKVAYGWRWRWHGPLCFTCGMLVDKV